MIRLILRIQTHMNISTSVKDIPASVFITSYAEFLKRGGQIETPSWLNVVKTGISKKNSPQNTDWFYIRLASLARRFYLKGTIGIGSLRRGYGGKKKNGSRKAKKRLSSGKIIRFALQQLEKLKIIQKNQNKNRIITEKAQQDMNVRAKKLFFSLDENP